MSTTLDILIKLAADLEGGKSADEMLAQIRSNIRGATDDSARYQAKLAEMAGDSAIDRNAESIKELGGATRSLAQYTEDSAEPALAHLNDTTAEGEKRAAAFAGKQQELKKLFNEINQIMPGTGAILKTIFHPSLMTASIAALGGVIAGYELWNKRVEGLAATLGGLELPDISAGHISSINAGAEAWKNYNEALSKGREEAKSIDAASERRIAQINKELEATKNLLAAQKAGELANLEAHKDEMPSEDFERKKKSINSRYASAGIAVEKEAGEDVVGEKEKRRLALAKEAIYKKAAAEKIKVPTAESDEQDAKDLNAARDVAISDNAVRQKRINKIDANSEDTVAAAKAVPEFFSRYGFMTGGEAIGVEKEQMESNKAAIDRAAKFEERKKKNEEKRKKKEELLSQSAAAQLAKEKLDLELNGSKDEFGNEVDAPGKNDPAKKAALETRNKIIETGVADLSVETGLAKKYKAGGKLSDDEKQLVTSSVRDDKGNEVGLQRAVESLDRASKDKSGKSTNILIGRLITYLERDQRLAIARAQEQADLERRILLLESRPGNSATGGL